MQTKMRGLTTVCGQVLARGPTSSSRQDADIFADRLICEVASVVRGESQRNSAQFYYLSCTMYRSKVTRGG